MAASTLGTTENVSKETNTHKKILADFAIVYQSRLISNHIRKEVLSGKAKFGIESSGKELLQIALASAFQKGDFFSGYYRDQTFMLKKALATTTTIFASLYGDNQNDPYSGGRQMNNHFATPFINKDGTWKNLSQEFNVSSAISALAGHVPRALGLALASKKFRANNTNDHNSKLGNELSFCTIGDSATSEGVFFEVFNAAGVLQVPMVFVVQDDGWGISVPTEKQTTKGSISEALKGFKYDKKTGTGLDIYTVKAWDYAALHKIFNKAALKTRKTHIPSIIHVTECTQQNGHSTSGSHERYKSKERLKWEKEKDCLAQFETWIIDNNWVEPSTLIALKEDIASTFKKNKQIAWQNYLDGYQGQQKDLMNMLNQLITAFPANQKLPALYARLKNLRNASTSEILQIAEKVMINLVLERVEFPSKLKAWYREQKQDLQKKYSTQLYSNSDKSAIKIPVVKAQYDADSPSIKGYEILNKYFDQLFAQNDKVYAFGEDVGKIGGVNQSFAGLQAKYGEDRIFDTGIREWSIIGKAIGMSMRGLRPIAEIQYLDYLVYALPALADDLATLRWRTNGQQMAPAIIRTRGYRLEGIWHSGSPIGLLLSSARGIYILTPRNMTQAVGMYNTMLQSDDPGIIIECLNGYRKKEQLPNNLGDFTVPLGVPEIIKVGEDITLVTYGVCVHIAERAVKTLEELGISVELIDVQTLLPFDLEEQILASIKKTNRVIFLDEDIPGAASAYMMQEVLEKQGAYRFLDSKPLTISAKAHRPPYTDNGNYSCKPTEYSIINAAVSMMNEFNSEVYGNLAGLIME